MFNECKVYIDVSLFKGVKRSESSELKRKRKPDQQISNFICCENDFSKSSDNGITALSVSQNLMVQLSLLFGKYFSFFNFATNNFQLRRKVAANSSSDLNINCVQEYTTYW